MTPLSLAVELVGWLLAAEPDLDVRQIAEVHKQSWQAPGGRWDTAVFWTARGGRIIHG